jgi:hypothetical protein
MDHLAPPHVPLYRTAEERDRLWRDCRSGGLPVVAVRVGARGYVVRYDLQPLDRALTDAALADLRATVRAWRDYPTAGSGSGPVGADPVSEAEGIGGEAGRVSGALHAPSEAAARRLAARLSTVVFDRANWT